MKILIDILLVSIICNGWYIITHGNMVLDPFRLWVIDYIGGVEKADGSIQWPLLNTKGKILKFIYKPTLGCIMCMSSVPGSIAYWTIHKFNFTESALIYWPIICISASYGNYLLYLILRKLEE